MAEIFIKEWGKRMCDLLPNLINSFVFRNHDSISMNKFKIFLENNIGQKWITSSAKDKKLE